MLDGLFSIPSSSNLLRFNDFNRESLEDRKSLPWMTLLFRESLPRALTASAIMKTYTFPHPPAEFNHDL
jgi:hypothetical protein